MGKTLSINYGDIYWWKMPSLFQLVFIKKKLYDAKGFIVRNQRIIKIWHVNIIDKIIDEI